MDTVFGNTTLINKIVYKNKFEIHIRIIKEDKIFEIHNPRTDYINWITEINNIFFTV